MEKIKISIEKKQITEFSNAFIFRHKRKAVATVEIDLQPKNFELQQILHIQ